MLIFFKHKIKPTGTVLKYSVITAIHLKMRFINVFLLQKEILQQYEFYEAYSESKGRFAVKKIE